MIYINIKKISMESVKPFYIKISVILILIKIVHLQGITVNPLCPTNKIAPHRRVASWEHARGRTFGAYYDLLTPDNRPNRPPYNDLQEKPQEDDPDDCGDIEDYDENDLSSINQSPRRRGHRDDRQYLGAFFHRPHFNNPNKIPTTFRPQRPTYPPTRPPFWSAGIFGDNPYRPPLLQHPSDFVKPVHENAQQVQETYNPYVVGGPLGHVVGFTPARPTAIPNDDVRSPRSPNYPRFSTSTLAPVYSTRRPRSRKINENTILGSFIDLLFK